MGGGGGERGRCFSAPATRDRWIVTPVIHCALSMDGQYGAQNEMQNHSEKRPWEPAKINYIWQIHSGKGKFYRTNAIAIIFYHKKPCDGANFDCAGLCAWDITCIKATTKFAKASHVDWTDTVPLIIYCPKEYLFSNIISGNGSPTSPCIREVFDFDSRFPFLVRCKPAGVFWNRSNALLLKVRENLPRRRGKNKRKFKWSSQGNKVECELLCFKPKSYSFGSRCLRKFGRQRSSCSHSESSERWIVSTDLGVVCLQLLSHSCHWNFSKRNNLFR